MINLNYIVELKAEANPEILGEEIGYAFGGLLAYQKSYLRTPEFRRKYVHYITLRPSELSVQVRIPDDIIDLNKGGLTHLFSLFFGNPFRSNLIKSAMLTKIELSNDIEKIFLGPKFGIDNFTDLYKSVEFPLLSVAIPYDFDEISHKFLKMLVDGGISFFIESPMSISNISYLKNVINILSEISVQCDRDLFYFINCTANLELINELIQFCNNHALIGKLRTGLRFCPISLGFSIINLIRQNEILLLGYNLLYKYLTSNTSYVISSNVLNYLFRISGCDIVNIGLRASDVMLDQKTPEMIDALLSTVWSNHIQSIPLFTGGIIPRVAFQVVKKFGTQNILHTSGPIFRTDKNTKYKRNVLAIYEAAHLSNQYDNIDEALKQESQNTKNWRSYEKEYGIN